MAKLPPIPQPPNWRESSSDDNEETGLVSSPQGDSLQIEKPRFAECYRLVWELAWLEFQSAPGFRWMKHGSALLAFLLFTVLGVSLYGLAQFFFPFLPVYGWVLTFLTTTIIAQGYVIQLAGRSLERKRLSEAKTKLRISYDENNPVYKDDSGPSGLGLYYKTRYVGVMSPVGGKTAVFVPTITLANGSVHPNVQLKPMAHQSEELEPNFSGYWAVVQMNTSESQIKLMRKGNEIYNLGAETEFEIVARCAGAENRRRVRARIVEHEIEEVNESGETHKSIDRQFEFELI